MTKRLVSLAVAAALVGCSSENYTAKAEKIINKCPKGSIVTIQLAVSKLTGETATVSCALIKGGDSK